MSSFLSRDEKWRFYTKNEENSEYLKKCIIFKEDKYFYYHPGINPVSVIRAFYNNIVSGEIGSGASTITMQTARLLQPKARTYLNKIIEIFRALQLEFHYSKDEILELYLNKIPFGGNIEGTGAASVLYFGKNANKLSLSESAALSVIPNSPKQLNISRMTDKINIRKNKLLENILTDNLFSKDFVNDGIRENVKPYRREAPRTAPHLARRAVNENPLQNVIVTTLNYTMQTRAEELVYNYMSGWQNYGVHNAAAIIINNLNSEIIAYVGSNNFWDNAASGQVDGVTSVRSPGSTLKPLLYAIAVDKGLITPKLSLLDVPILDPDYAPANFDGKYRGRVTAEYALSHSLNVPAVNLLEQIGYKNFTAQLSKMNFCSITKKQKDLGLSLILGGCGVTLEELTDAYSVFTNSGQYRKSEYLKAGKLQNFSAISVESAYMITDILAKLERPDLPQNNFYAKSIPLIAWKTGTSQGKRDGWAIGFNGAYTIGVWTGNFSGKPNAAISGANVAVPLLFDLFHSVANEEKRSWLKMPPGIDTRIVDATTGLLPSEYSRYTVSDYYIPGVSKSRITDHLKPIWVSDDEKISYCSDCLPIKGVKTKIYEIFPVELLYYFKTQNIAVETVPPHNPECQNKRGGEPPVIISPKNKSEYFIEKGSGEGISLNAKTENDAEKIYWFVNDKFLNVCKAGDFILWLPPEKGIYKITCTDNKGRTSEISFSVKIY